MKYLVNRETKEHRIYNFPDYVPPLWDLIEADSEGWIKHDSPEQPLPTESLCEMKIRNGGTIKSRAGAYFWKSIEAYRPILDTKPEQFSATLESAPDILDRFDAAHEAAEQIPDILALIRERVGKHGYDLVQRDPFVEPDEDMSDWRNWREGDLVECISVFDAVGDKWPTGTAGSLYELQDPERSGSQGVIDGQDTVQINADNGEEVSIPVNMLRFHSRPTKGAK